jgi:hypothetical protein
MESRDAFSSKFEQGCPLREAVRKGKVSGTLLLRVRGLRVCGYRLKGEDGKCTCLRIFAYDIINARVLACIYRQSVRVKLVTNEATCGAS